MSGQPATFSLKPPRLWQLVLALLVGWFVATQTSQEDRRAIRLLEEGERVEASILSVEEKRRGGNTPTVCRVEFRIVSPAGGARLMQDHAPSVDCREWHRLLERGKTPQAEALVGRDGKAMLRVEAILRQSNAATLPAWLRFVLSGGGVLVISMVLRGFLPPRE